MWIILLMLFVIGWCALPGLLLDLMWKDKDDIDELLANSHSQHLLKLVRGTRNGVMNYMVAGIWNQPYTAHAFLQKLSFFSSDGITEVPHSPYGMNYTTIYDAIVDDVQKHGYKKVRIICISVSCRVARYFNLRQMFKDDLIMDDPLDGVQVQCVEINPYWTPDFAKPLVRLGFALLYIVTWPLVLAAGWLSALEVIPQSGHWFSLRHTQDVLKNVAFNRSKSMTENTDICHRYKELTKMIVLSEKDQFLDNARVKEYYKGTHTYMVNTDHSNTMVAADEYVRVFREAVENGDLNFRR